MLFLNVPSLNINDGGDEESRTPDLVLARHALYQLSYAPISTLKNKQYKSNEFSLERR